TQTTTSNPEPQKTLNEKIRVFLSLHAEGHPESFGCDDKSQRRMVMSSARVVNEEKRQFYNRVNKLFDI
ncbi:hypothetical protein, partial [Shigella sonnei]